MTDDVARAVETELIELSGLLTEPGEYECLRCYLMRMLHEFGCDGTHRWTRRWRDLRAPGAQGLISKLQRRGGCCCDCEVILNVYPDYPQAGRLLPCAGQPQADSAAPCTLRYLRHSA